MAFTGLEGDIIHEPAAAAMTRAYRDTPGTTVHSQFFGKQKLKQMIDAAGPDYIGIRIYNALDDDNNPCFVLTCVQADGNDLADTLLANGPTCPPTCNPEGSLSQ